MAKRVPFMTGQVSWGMIRKYSCVTVQRKLMISWGLKLLTRSKIWLDFATLYKSLSNWQLNTHRVLAESKKMCTKSAVSFSRGILREFARVPFSTAENLGDHDKFRCTFIGSLILAPFPFSSKHWFHRLWKFHCSKSCFSSMIDLPLLLVQPFPWNRNQ